MSSQVVKKSEKSKNFDKKSNPNQSKPNQSEPNQSKPNQNELHGAIFFFFFLLCALKTYATSIWNCYHTHFNRYFTEIVENMGQT